MKTETEQLNKALERAKFKMLLEQKRDPNCVWAEFEALIWTVEDFLKKK